MGATLCVHVHEWLTGITQLRVRCAAWEGTCGWLPIHPTVLPVSSGSSLATPESTSFEVAKVCQYIHVCTAVWPHSSFSMHVSRFTFRRIIWLTLGFSSHAILWIYSGMKGLIFARNACSYTSLRYLWFGCCTEQQHIPRPGCYSNWTTLHTYSIKIGQPLSRRSRCIV